MFKNSFIRNVIFFYKKKMTFGENLISFNKDMYYTLRGFTKKEVDLFELNKNNYEYYIPLLKQNKISQINGGFSLIFNDKKKFRNYFYGVIPIVENTFEIRSENYIRDINSKTEISMDELKYKMKNKSYVFKPEKGGGGKGVFAIENKANDWFYNDKKTEEKEIFKIISGLSNYLITPKVEQCKQLATIYSRATNTFRIIMMRDPYTNKMFTPRVLLRIGNNSTGITDNFNDGNGGYVGIIDNKYYVKKVYKFEGNKKTIITKHPDTKEELTNLYFPQLEDVINDIESKINNLSEIKYVGWDVVLLDDGGYTIIEGNNHPDTLMAQLDSPYLKDELIRDFFKYWCVIK